MSIIIKGIPSNVGALNTGTELAPKLLRKANLVEALKLNHEVMDLGDVTLPNNMIKHNVAPIRNWPSPRLMWEESMNQLDSCFSVSDFTIILGGSCSVFTGVFNKFHQLYRNKAKVISLDHHIDVKEPNSEVCMGATAFTHWFLTENNQWFKKPVGFGKESIVALGYSEDVINEDIDVSGIVGYSQKDITKTGVVNVLKSCLGHMGTDDKIIIHFDLDIISESDLQSVYMPSPKGMNISIVKDLLKGLVADPRVLGIVITEFSGAYKESEDDAKKVVKLIVDMFE